MRGLNRDSRESIFFGVSYVIAAEWSADAIKRLEFQKLLAENQLDFSQTRFGDGGFSLIRADPGSFIVNITSPAPKVTSLSISSERGAGLEIFCREAEAVCRAYRSVWTGEQVQILKCTATVRQLYSCTEHAFKYLWEERLGQKPEDFKHLGARPVLGGGLRLIMPPIKGDQEPLQIEVKVESFFRESGKMFIETVFVWPMPRLLNAGEQFDPKVRLAGVEQYSITKVCDFITLGVE